MNPEYGWLTDYELGTTLRAATREEWLLSTISSGHGTFDHDGVKVYVEGGPDEDPGGKLPGTPGGSPVGGLMRRAAFVQERRKRQERGK